MEKKQYDTIQDYTTEQKTIKKEEYDTTWHGMKHYDKKDEYDTWNKIKYYGKIPQ